MVMEKEGRDRHCADINHRILETTRNGKRQGKKCHWRLLEDFKLLAFGAMRNILLLFKAT
jgi:hypothetical protein